MLIDKLKRLRITNFPKTNVQNHLQQNPKTEVGDQLGRSWLSVSRRISLDSNGQGFYQNFYDNLLFAYSCNFIPFLISELTSALLCPFWGDSVHFNPLIESFWECLSVYMLPFSFLDFLSFHEIFSDNFIYNGKSKICKK